MESSASSMSTVMVFLSSKMDILVRGKRLSDTKEITVPIQGNQFDENVR